MYGLKKWNGIFTSKSAGTGPSSYKKKLPGLGLTKFDKHWPTQFLQRLGNNVVSLVYYNIIVTTNIVRFAVQQSIFSTKNIKLNSQHYLRQSEQTIEYKK